MLQFDTVGTSGSTGDESFINPMVMDEDPNRAQKPA